MAFLRRVWAHRDVASLILIVAAFVLVKVSNSDRINELQRSRVQATITACQEQNARHVATVDTLDARLAAVEAHATDGQRASLKQSRQFTTDLIDALAPYENCVLRARRLTRP